MTETWPIPAAAFVRMDAAAPRGVKAMMTTREGGCSVGPYGLFGGAAGGLNLGARCGDDPAAVAANRRALASCLPNEPSWLDQVHGTTVAGFTAANAVAIGEPVADAAVTREPGKVLAVLTADCLPVVFWETRGRAVGIAHAGWRGLAAGILEHTADALAALCPESEGWHAHLGPGIGPTAFEVGEDVLSAFASHDRRAERAFAPGACPGKWLADLGMLALQRLEGAGVRSTSHTPGCTFRDAARYFSHRRDRVTGRMATLVWISESGR